VVTSAIAVRPQGRSLTAFVLTPTASITDRLAALDKRRESSPAFFVGRPIILDLAAIALSESQIGEVITQLAERGIWVMALEGIEADRLGPSLPPVLNRGRSTAGEMTFPPSSHKSVANPLPLRRQEPSSLLIENPIRSGQSVIFPTATSPCSARWRWGPKSSPAHRSTSTPCCVAGPWPDRWAMRGRGFFAAKNEAELVSIDGYYRTAEEMDASLRSRPAQCWLENRVFAIAAWD
jgi:septum site-determining protein MinC